MPRLDPAWSWTAALALAAVFAGSAAIKFADLGLFQAALENYRLLPRPLPRPASYLIPALETAAAASLMIIPIRPWAAELALALLVTFSAAIAINLLRGRREIDCGCFGSALQQPLSGALLARNAALAALAVIALVPAGTRPLAALDLATVAGGGLSLALLYVAANFMLANAPHLRALRQAHG